jgi:hypothetical protein
MDVQAASQGRPWRAGDFAPENFAIAAPDWFADARTRDMPKHVAPSLMFKAAVAADAAAWVHVAGLPGASPAVEAGTAAPGEWKDPALWRDAARADLKAILASPDWAAYMDGLVAGMTAAGYPQDRMVYLEPWNEVWNVGGPWARMTFFAEGAAQALGVDPNPTILSRHGYGYLAAHVMAEFDAALRRAGRRQAWTLVLGTQLAWTPPTSAALDGFKAYFAERGADPKPWLAHAGVAGASYYASEAFQRGPSGFIEAASDAEHAARWKAAIAADRDGLMKRFADEYLANAARGDSVPGLIRMRKAHREIAEREGAFYLGDYEGESHALVFWWLAGEPEIVNWAEDLVVSVHGERLTREWARRHFAEDPAAVLANYLSIGPRDPEGSSPGDRNPGAPWIDGLYGEDNARLRGLKELER